MKTKEFEELRDSSIGHALVRAGRLYNQYLFEQLKESLGQEGFLPSHHQLFAHIPFEGITIVDLAKKAKISKQAVSVLVKFLLDKGVLIKQDNPNDNRSFLVTFDQGKDSALFKGMKVVKEIDKELNNLLSSEEAKTTFSALEKIIEKYQIYQQ